jgi:hypothetical protein
MTRILFPMFAAPMLAGAVLAAASPALAAPAGHAAAKAAGEHRLSAAEIRALARREMLWCDEYRPASDTCSSITLVQLSPDGRLAETTAVLISEGPRIQAYIGEVDDLRGDEVCTKVATSSLPTAFTLEGQTVPPDDAAPLRSYLTDPIADFDGKTICQTYFRGADPNALREEVTVDGERRQDLDTTYRLHESGDGFVLRQRGGADDGGQKT